MIVFRMGERKFIVELNNPHIFSFRGTIIVILQLLNQFFKLNFLLKFNYYF